VAHHAYKRVWYVGPDAVHDTTVTASGEKIRVTGRRLEAQEIRDDVLTALRKQDKTAWSTTEPKARPEGAYTGPVQHISPPVAHDAVGTTYTTVSVGYVQYQGAQNPHNEQVNIDGYQQFMLGCVPGEILGLPEPVCSYLVGMEPNWWAPANGWTPPAAGPQTGYVATVYSAYTQDLANGVILGNATSGGTFAIDLLDATTAVGKQVQIKNTGTANNIVLTAVSGQTIDSASTASLGPGEACTIFSDGSAALWRCLSVPAASQLPTSVGAVSAAYAGNGLVIGSQGFSSGEPQVVAGIPVTNLQGLRRWSRQYTNKDVASIPICCVGDSQTFGQFANGTNTETTTDNLQDAPLSYPARLRALMNPNTSPGEGFLFPGTATGTAEGRIAVGSGVTSNAPHPGAMRRGAYLPGGSYPNTTLTYVAEAGVTLLGVILENTAGLGSPTWSKNGVNKNAWTTLDNSGGYSLVYHVVTAGDVIVLTGLNGTSSNVIGFVTRTGTAPAVGIPVHRIGVGGQAQGQMLGGVYNGLLASIDGVNQWTGPQMTAYIRAHYAWETNPGLLIVKFGTNDQTYQQGTAGQNNGVTPTIFGNGVQQVVNQAVADGWCVLLKGPPVSPTQNNAGGAAPLSAYKTVMQQIAANTDHCAFWDIADQWGITPTNASALGLQDTASSHSTARGYADEASTDHKILTTIALGT
jgi:hypothetical protein